MMMMMRLFLTLLAGFGTGGFAYLQQSFLRKLPTVTNFRRMGQYPITTSTHPTTTEDQWIADEFERLADEQPSQIFAKEVRNRLDRQVDEIEALARDAMDQVLSEQRDAARQTRVRQAIQMHTLQLMNTLYAAERDALRTNYESALRDKTILEEKLNAAITGRPVDPKPKQHATAEPTKEAFSDKAILEDKLNAVLATRPVDVRPMEPGAKPILPTPLANEPLSDKTLLEDKLNAVLSSRPVDPRPMTRSKPKEDSKRRVASTDIPLLPTDLKEIANSFPFSQEQIDHEQRLLTGTIPLASPVVTPGSQVDNFGPSVKDITSTKHVECSIKILRAQQNRLWKQLKPVQTDQSAAHRMVNWAEQSSTSTQDTLQKLEAFRSASEKRGPVPLKGINDSTGAVALTAVFLFSLPLWQPMVPDPQLLLHHLFAHSYQINDLVELSQRLLEEAQQSFHANWVNHPFQFRPIPVADVSFQTVQQELSEFFARLNELHPHFIGSTPWENLLQVREGGQEALLDMSMRLKNLNHMDFPLELSWKPDTVWQDIAVRWKELGQ